MRGSEEMELARSLGPRSSDLDAARGLLFVHTGEVPEGLRWLGKARESVQASQPGVPVHRSLPILTLDLVEAELTLPSPRRDPARWLEDEASRAALGQRPPLLQERWRQLVPKVRLNQVEPTLLHLLCADLQRAEAFPHREWVAGAASPILSSR